MTAEATDTPARAAAQAPDARVGTVRSIAAGVLLLAAFPPALFFQGTGANIVLLGVVVALVLAALTLVPKTPLLAFIRERPLACGAALGALLWLVLAYRFSISAENSFAPSFVLAMLPLTFLLCGGLGEHPRLLRAVGIALAAIVLALAVVSVVRFVGLGARAGWPLIDPNNYATLIYLVWIPALHRYFARHWSGAVLPRSGRLIVALASAVMLAALFATQSRAGAVIVAAALLLWLAMAFWHTRPWRPVAVHALLAGGVFVAVSALAALPASRLGAEGLASGAGTRGALFSSALAMLAERPFGSGTFTFPLLYPGYRLPGDQLTLGLFVHNDYLQFLIEGGPVLALLLVFFALAVAIACLRGALAAPSSRRFRRAGLAMALGAAAAHASINFVFYALPLLIVMGYMAARLFPPASAARRARSELREAVASPASPPGRAKAVAGVTLALGFGWLLWLHLALDVATAGVLGGQRGVPLAQHIRADEDRMLRFARHAQRLNANRGLPPLAEAMILHNKAVRDPGDHYLLERALSRYRKALEVDPWNIAAYIAFARHLDVVRRDPTHLRPGESPEALLRVAVGLNPASVPALDALLDYYERHGEEAKRLALLRGVVLPRLALIARRDASARDRYLEELRAHARASGDRDLEQRLEAL